jgi:hypothetical protein
MLSLHTLPPMSFRSLSDRLANTTGSWMRRHLLASVLITLGMMALLWTVEFADGLPPRFGWAGWLTIALFAYVPVVALNMERLFKRASVDTLSFQWIWSVMPFYGAWALWLIANTPKWLTAVGLAESVLLLGITVAQVKRSPASPGQSRGKY